jgi:diguanylate cyclase (GGDEF)-like protein
LRPIRTFLINITFVVLFYRFSGGLFRPQRRRQVICDLKFQWQPSTDAAKPWFMSLTALWLLRGHVSSVGRRSRWPILEDLGMDINHLAHIDIPLTTTLAMLATLAYVFGTLHRRKKAGNNEQLLQMRKDLSRAMTVVNELGNVICTVRDNTARHYARLREFEKRIARLGTHQGDASWQELCQEVEALLDPTLQLVSEITSAQERIRYQSNYLMTFSEMRTDPLTGLGNRRALDQVLAMQFGVQKRCGTPFSLAIIDIDHFKDLNDQCGHQHGDQVLCDLKDLLLGTLRGIDFLTRYGGDELVVVMPQTDSAAAAVVGQRLRAEVECGMPVTVSIGLASATAADTPESLFRRADAAMYRAKNGGRNRIFSDPDETIAAMSPTVAIAACCQPQPESPATELTTTA